jgi:hypothetical protein
VQKPCGGPGSAADDNAISFPKAYEASSRNRSGPGCGVTFASLVTQKLKLLVVYLRYRHEIQEENIQEPKRCL